MEKATQLEKKNKALEIELEKTRQEEGARSQTMQKESVDGSAYKNVSAAKVRKIN